MEPSRTCIQERMKKHCGKAFGIQRLKVGSDTLGDEPEIKVGILQCRHGVLYIPSEHAATGANLPARTHRERELSGVGEGEILFFALNPGHL